METVEYSELRVVYYSVPTQTFFHLQMLADPTWAPRTEKQLARYLRLRSIDTADAAAEGANHSWMVTIFDRRAAIAFTSGRAEFTDERADALSRALKELLGTEVTVGCVVSNLAAKVTRVALAPHVPRTCAPLLAFCAAVALNRIDWSQDSDAYDPFIVELVGPSASRLHVWFESSKGTVTDDPAWHP